MYGSFVTLTVGCASLKMEERGSYLHQDETFHAKCNVRYHVFGCTHMDRNVHSRQHMGATQAHRRTTLHFGPRASTRPGVRGAEGALGFWRKLCLNFSAMSLRMAAATARMCSQS